MMQYIETLAAQRLDQFFACIHPIVQSDPGVMAGMSDECLIAYCEWKTRYLTPEQLTKGLS